MFSEFIAQPAFSLVLFIIYGSILLWFLDDSKSSVAEVRSPAEPPAPLPAVLATPAPDDSESRSTTTTATIIKEKDVAEQQPAVKSIAVELKIAKPVDMAAELKSKTAQELRKACSNAGIKWRNAQSNGKHLKKGQMIEALLAEQSPPPQSQPAEKLLPAQVAA